jgi:ABC-type lipoprotein export system ATPase subunit
MITAMFQGKDKEDAYAETKQVLESLNVPAEQDRSIRHYSGGQRQRLAFARAILPNFNVLFGDEPTGNLDKGSAENVTRILQAKVHERNVTAVIVSHDMRLAEKYADMIVQIQRKERVVDAKTDYYGVINDSGVFHKDEDGWSGLSQRYSNDDFLKKLEGAL